MRPKLSIPAQIKDMQAAGIKFDVMSETEASRYLELHTYYFKIKAYAKNYDKYVGTDKQGQYINLDFAYLVELSELDTDLRRIVLRMATELEHFLKVKLLADCNIVDEDGYEIVEELFKMQPHLKEDIEGRTNTSTCNDLVEKYKGNWAIWNIVEVMSLSPFTELYALFYNRNSFRDIYLNMLLPVRMLRNAAAHNNCMINRLKPPYSRTVAPCYELRNELVQDVGLSIKSIDKKLIHPTINDFATLLFLYSRFVPITVREPAYCELRKLFHTRMLKNKAYFVKNQIISSNYEFTRCIVDYYVGG